MLLLTDLLPSRLRLRWGMTQAECVSLLGIIPKRRAEAYAILDIPIRGQPHQMVLRLDDRGGLSRIRADLHMSRDFWEEYTPEEMDALTREYHHRYLALVEEHIALLDPPTFSGSWGEEAYPDDETAWKITLAAGRMGGAGQARPRWFPRDHPVSLACGPGLPVGAEDLAFRRWGPALCAE